MNIVFIIACAFLLFLVFYFRKCKRFIVREFKRCNCIAFGRKGDGKDLLFSWVVRRRKKPYYSNIEYVKKLHNPIDLKACSVAPNTYENLIDGEIEPIEKTLQEGCDIYFSDLGIYAPSQYHSLLDKKYPSFPIFYATQRHLLNSNFHGNSQNLGRIWDKIREQADSYFKCLSTVVVFYRIALTKVRYYEEYESAKGGLRPFKCGLLASKEKRALKADYDAKHGLVKHLYLLQWLPRKTYDTRIFHRLFYGSSAPK